MFPLDEMMTNRSIFCSSMVVMRSLTSVTSLLVAYARSTTSPLSKSHHDEPSCDWMTPALMMFATSEPEVMKSATI